MFRSLEQIGRITVLLAFLLLTHLQTSAQHQADNWILNRHVGLSFATGEPVPIYGTQLDYYNCPASVSDKTTGQLLFYSDGMSVWDRNNNLMPNGTDLKGSKLGPQSTLATPIPLRPNLYYLFSLAEKSDQYSNGNYGLWYSIVDMNLHNGMGDIPPNFKSILLEKEVNHKLTAVYHANGRDYWLITHGLNDDTFLVYLITPKGISLNKKIQVGPIHLAVERGDFGLSGTLKASPNGKHLACVTAITEDSQGGRFEFYDFDSKNGTISNYRSLGEKYMASFSTSFSPNSTKLYLTGDDYPGMTSCQFDLNNPLFGTSQYQPIPVQIYKKWGQDSVIRNIEGDLQMASNGKIYGIVREAAYGGQAFNQLMVIDYPDSLGLACKPRRIDLDYGEAAGPMAFLPNFITGIFDKSPPDSTFQYEDFTCGNDLLVYPNPLTDDWVTIEMDPKEWRQECNLNAVKVYDTRGILLYERTNISETFKINVRNWSAGIYIFEFHYYNGTEGNRTFSNRVTRKIVVQ